ncbi:NPCBM/NEW2 domain-containing protein [Demequina silvatica]|uniref:NPCBM/NEW2 domain-containing protein n=1 Tax=Demequina silvatica TaxID=1638988 RepID=UPI000783A783|nr:NPCBM/NEW2 domain-containing protein [Demequina silvatica]
MADARTARRGALRVASWVALLTVALAVGLAAPPADAAGRTAARVTIDTVRPAGGGLLVAGERAVVRGTASANLGGARLTLQRRIDGEWVRSGTSTRVGPRGGFRIAFTARGMGATRYRVVADGTATRAPARDASTVTVWRWISLVPHRVDSSLRVGPATVGGWRYARVLHAAGTAGGPADVGTIALDGRCDRVTAVVGVTDRSAPAFLTVFALSLDGVPRLQGAAVGTGMSALVALKTAGADRLGLEAEYPALPGASAGHAVWAQPQGLCRAYPGR